MSQEDIQTIVQQALQQMQQQNSQQQFGQAPIIEPDGIFVACFQPVGFTQKGGTRYAEYYLHFGPDHAKTPMEAQNLIMGMIQQGWPVDIRYSQYPKNMGMGFGPQQPIGFGPQQPMGFQQQSSFFNRRY